MLRKTTALLLIWGFLITGNLSNRIFAQARNNSSDAKQTVRLGENVSKPVLKEIFDREIAKSKFNVSDATVDSKKIEKESRNPQTKKPGMTKNEKTFLVLFLVGLTVLVVLVAKYGKVPYCDEIYCAPEDTCPCNERK